MDKHIAVGGAEQAKKAACITDAIAYIDKNYKNDISLEEIASHVGYSRCYFSSMFKQHMGMSPIDYISVRRIDEAMRLLRDTDLPVFKIATECGFNNAVNFCRVFKKITKKPPSVFREEKVRFDGI